MTKNSLISTDVTAHHRGLPKARGQCLLVFLNKCSPELLFFFLECLKLTKDISVLTFTPRFGWNVFECRITFHLDFIL